MNRPMPYQAARAGLRLVGMLIFPLMALAAQAGGDFAPAMADVTAPAIHSRQAIIERLAALPGTASGSPYIEAPSLKPPYAAGRLKPEFLARGLGTLNLFRYLAGLNDSVAIDPDWTATAQHAAALLAIRDKGLDHSPAYPEGINLPRAFYDRGYAGTSSSNLAEGQDDLGEAVRSFMDDSDDSNIDRLGHRRWVLSPDLQRVGFGLAKEYCALRVFDPKSLDRGSQLAYVAWPGVGEQPLGWFGAGQAWSFSLNPGIPGGLVASRNSVSVHLVRQRDQKRWDFSAKASNGYFNLETTNFGLPLCIIFRPDRLDSLLDGDRFSVVIEGVKDKQGRSVAIHYECAFFGTGPTIKAVVASSHPARLTIHAQSTSRGMKAQAADLDGLQATMGYVGPALTGFSWYVDSPDGILPIGIEINGDGVIHAPGEMIQAPAGGIHHFRLVANETSLQYTGFAQSKGWGKWVKAGEAAGFDDNTPLQTITISLH